MVGGPGADTLDDSRGGHSSFYDHEGENRIVKGKGTEESNQPYETPRDRQGNALRDWGSQVLKIPWVSAGGDLGVFLGAASASSTTASANIPTPAARTCALVMRPVSPACARNTTPNALHELAEADGHRAALHGRRFPALLRLRQRDHASSGDDEFYRVYQRQSQFRMGWRLGFDHVDLTLGPVVKMSHTPTDDPNRFISSRSALWHRNVRTGRARRPLRRGQPRTRVGERRPLQAEGTYYPQVWYVRSGFGEVHGQAGVVLGTSSGPRPTLALRAGGKRVFGDYPFHEAAFIGGSDSVRSLRPQRYAGDAAVYGNAELRLRLFRASFLVPADVGILGLADAGRVFVLPDPSTNGIRRWAAACG